MLIRMLERAAVYERRTVFGVIEIHRRHMGPPAGRGDVRRGRVCFGPRTVVGERDVHPTSRELVRDDGADAAATGDERGAAGQIHALRLYPVRPLMFRVTGTSNT